jgi:PKD repeat protein
MKNTEKRVNCMNLDKSELNQKISAKKGPVARRLLALLLAVGSTVIALSACDDLVTEVTEVTIAGHPNAEFRVDTGFVDSGCVPMTVKFRDISDGPRDQWLWSFGDGNTSTDTNPSHVYDSAGTYTVTLKISDSETQGTDTEVKTRFIIVGASISGFTFDTGQICRGDSVSFVSTVGGITSWSWNFGDLTANSTDTFPVHVFDSAGTFEVTLVVNGGCGVDSVKDSITIDPCPIVAFLLEPGSDTIGCAPFSVILNDSSVVDPPETIASRLWDFGGGTTTDTSGIVSHEYTTAGDYTVTLTITSTDGTVATDSIVDLVSVTDSVSIGFMAQSPTKACYSQFQQFAVKFLDTSKGDIIERNWDFGDGTVDNTNNPEPYHAYDSGRYTVQLEIIGVCNNVPVTQTLSMTDFVVLSVGTLTSAPIQIDSIDDTTYMFTDNTVGDIYSRIWDFGDGGAQGIDSNGVTHVFSGLAGDGILDTLDISVTSSNFCDTSAQIIQLIID